MWRANATILVVLCGLITAIGLDTKPWPFNNYPMFAHMVRSWPVYWTRGDVAAHLALIPVGVDGQQPEREHVLEARHLAPQATTAMMMAFNKMLGNWQSGSIFPGSRTEAGVADLRARAEQKKAVLGEALLDLKNRYTRQRRPDEPPLVGVRLYLMKRDYSNPDTLSMSDATEREPSLRHRVLIFEVMGAP